MEIIQYTRSSLPSGNEDTLY